MEKSLRRIRNDGKRYKPQFSDVFSEESEETNGTNSAIDIYSNSLRVVLKCKLCKNEFHTTNSGAIKYICPKCLKRINNENLLNFKINNTIDVSKQKEPKQ